MPATAPSLAESLSRLTASWQRQGIACPPATVAHIRRATAISGVVLPADFGQLYRTANGTPDLYPNEMDEQYCSFLPVEALRSEAAEWAVKTAGVVALEQAAVTVFVDFMHRSWEYGFLVDPNGPHYRIGRLLGEHSFEVLTPSLSTFLQWYVADDDGLYGLR